MDDVKKQTAWVEIALAMIPLIIAIMTGTFILYGKIQELTVAYDFLKTEQRRHNLELHEDITKHSAMSAHGTVKEELTKHNTMLTAHNVRMLQLEKHAAVGERYTENDAKDDFKQVYSQLNSMKQEIIDLRRKVDK